MSRRVWTYADVELHGAPEHQVRAVAVFGDDLNLYHAHDAADCGEEAEGEDADEADFLARVDFDLEQKRDGEQDDNHVAQYGDGCEDVKLVKCRQYSRGHLLGDNSPYCNDIIETFPLSARPPGLVHWTALEE